MRKVYIYKVNVMTATKRIHDIIFLDDNVTEWYSGRHYQGPLMDQGMRWEGDEEPGFGFYEVNGPSRTNHLENLRDI